MERPSELRAVRAELKRATAATADLERARADLTAGVAVMHDEWRAASDAATLNETRAAEKARVVEETKLAARAKLRDARAEADRRVATAVREERRLAESKAREVRLASAARRRVERGVPTAVMVSGGGTWSTTPRGGGGGDRSAAASATPGSTTASKASPIDARYKAIKRVDAVMRREEEAWRAAKVLRDQRGGGGGGGGGGWEAPATSSRIARPVPARRGDVVVAARTPPAFGASATRTPKRTTTTTRTPARATRSAAAKSLRNGVHHANAVVWEPVTMTGREGRRPNPIHRDRPFATRRDPPSVEARRRAEARVAFASTTSKKRTERERLPSSSSPPPARREREPPLFTSSERRAAETTASSAVKAATLAARLARAERELRAAMATRERRSKDVEDLRRRAEDAEKAVSDRDARIAEAHRRAVAAALTLDEGSPARDLGRSFDDATTTTAATMTTSSGPGDPAFTFRTPTSPEARREVNQLASGLLHSSETLLAQAEARERWEAP